MSNKSFAALKRNNKSSYDKIITETNKLSSGGRESDDRFWQPTVDKAGNGYAVIRFLPAPVNEDYPWVRMFTHGFKGPGGWYIENSRTTIGENDPVSELNSQLWNRGDDEGKELARAQKRRLSYISNIYVVKDSANPDNEGRVFLYKYGKKIWDKMQDAMEPDFEDEMAINPFNLWGDTSDPDAPAGANFNLKIRKVEGYRNYDKSEFGDPSDLLDDDDALEEIWKKEHSLQELVDPKHFKSYEELKTKLNRALGSAVVTSTIEEVEEPPFEPDASPAPTIASADSEDSELDLFKQLAEDD